MHLSTWCYQHICCVYYGLHVLTAWIDKHNIYFFCKKWRCFYKNGYHLFATFPPEHETTQSGDLNARMANGTNTNKKIKPCQVISYFGDWIPGTITREERDDISLQYIDEWITRKPVFCVRVHGPHCVSSQHPSRIGPIHRTPMQWLGLCATLMTWSGVSERGYRNQPVLLCGDFIWGKYIV